MKECGNRTLIAVKSYEGESGSVLDHKGPPLIYSKTCLLSLRHQGILGNGGEHSCDFLSLEVCVRKSLGESSEVMCLFPESLQTQSGTNSFNPSHHTGLIRKM